MSEKKYYEPDLLHDCIENGLMEFRMDKGKFYLIMSDFDGNNIEGVNCYELSLYLDKYIKERYEIKRIKKTAYDLLNLG